MKTNTIKGLTPCNNEVAEIKLTYSNKVKPDERPKISQSSDAYRILLPLFDQGRLEHSEEFIMLTVNRFNAVTGWFKLSQGGISGTVVDHRIVAQIALNTNSSGVVLAHNHPSGSVKESEQDKAVTKKIKDALKLFDISVLDHLIVTPDKYLSFSDEGLI